MGVALEDRPDTGRSLWVRIREPAPRPAGPGAALAATALTLLTWPIVPRYTEVGVDASYEAALALARSRGFDVGVDTVFNYGPLGHLAVPMVDTGWGFVGWAVQVGVSALLAWLVVTALARRVSLFAAVVLGAVALWIPWGGGPVPLATRVVLVAMLWALAVVASDRRLPLWAVAGAGALAGLVFLVKADAGLLCAAIGATAVAGASWARDGVRAAARDLAVWVCAVVAAVLVGFVASGAPVDGLPTYLRGTAEIVRGFAGAMSVERSFPVALVEQLGVLAVAVAVLVLVLRDQAQPRPRRRAIAAVAAVAILMATRQGFVRYDAAHVRQLFAVMLLLPVALAVVWPMRKVLLVAAAVLVVLLPGQRPGPSWVGDAASRPLDVVRTSEAVVSPGARREALQARRDAIRAVRDLPDRFARQIGSDPVAIVPEHLEIALTHPELDWVPLPVLQDYQANTEWLDEHLASGLAGPGRPEWIIRASREQRVDDHFPRFDPPAANLATICGYEVVDTEPGFQLLHAVPNRCGPPQVVERRRVGFGDWVDTPQVSDDELVVARFSGVGSSLADRIRTLLLRGPRYDVGVDSDVFRFVPGTQGSWHVLSAPSCVDLTGTRQPVGRFRIAPRSGGAGGGYEVELARIPVDCDGTA